MPTNMNRPITTSLDLRNSEASGPVHYPRRFVFLAQVITRPCHEATLTASSTSPSPVVPSRRVPPPYPHAILHTYQILPIDFIDVCSLSHLSETTYILVARQPDAFWFPFLFGLPMVTSPGIRAQTA